MSVALKQAAAGCTLQPGELIGLLPVPGKVHVFDRQGVSLQPGVGQAPTPESKNPNDLARPARQAFHP